MTASALRIASYFTKKRTRGIGILHWTLPSTITHKVLIVSILSFNTGGHNVLFSGLLPTERNQLAIIFKELCMLSVLIIALWMGLCRRCWLALPARQPFMRVIYMNTTCFSSIFLFRIEVGFLFCLQLVTFDFIQYHLWVNDVIYVRTPSPFRMHPRRREWDNNRWRWSENIHKN